MVTYSKFLNSNPGDAPYLLPGVSATFAGVSPWSAATKAVKGLMALGRSLGTTIDDINPI